jgi:hypothetical protein
MNEYKRVAALNADELLKQYRILLAENKALLEENDILKARLGIAYYRVCVALVDQSFRKSSK